MYTFYHPTEIAGDAPYFVDSVEPTAEPVDMDETYTDEWIVREMLQGVRKQVDIYRGFIHSCDARLRNMYPWAQSQVPTTVLLP